MKKEMNEKAQGGMTWGTILAGVIALIILVLVLFFLMSSSGSWSDFMGNIFGGSTVNVANVVTGCKSACSTNIPDDYCTLKRSIVFVKGGKKELWTCQELQLRVPRLEGLEPCDNIQCSTQVVKCSDLVISNCHGLDPSKCQITWIPVATFTDYKANNMGQGKTYVSIDDLTGYVTDVNEQNQYKAQGQVCAKTIKP